MVRVYYHIYAIEGVEQIIEEQLSLIQKNFDFAYKLNIGICCSKENQNISKVFNILNGFGINYLLRDVRVGGNEFVTLDTMISDRNQLSEKDFVFYLHTKGASKFKDSAYNNIVDWRNLMMYFNVEKVKNVFSIFERTTYNTYGCLLRQVGSFKTFYDGNFWWAKGDYIKSLNLDEIRTSNRFNAETNFIQNGENWKPYSIHSSNINHYLEPYPIEKYKI
jgi:hypothetical protein